MCSLIPYLLGTYYIYNYSLRITAYTYRYILHDPCM